MGAGGLLRPDVACLIGLRNCEACTMTSYSYGKASVNSLGGPMNWVGASGNLQGRADSVSQVDGVLDKAPTCWLCGSVSAGFRKGTMTSAHISVWEKAVPQLLP